MIELGQWRACIGTFCQPRAWRGVTSTETASQSLKGACTFILLCALFICVANARSPVVNKLLLSGDVESNPGPGIEDVLQELRSFRADILSQFEALRADMSTLKTDMTVMRDEVDKVKEEMSGVSLKMGEMKKTVDTQYCDIDTLIFQFAEAKERIERMEETMEKQERYSRRDNVIIYGIEEQDGENATQKVVSVLNENLTGKTWSGADFVRAHRLGGKTGEKQRAIIARLCTSEDKFLITKARSILKEKGVGVSNDLTLNQRNQLQQLKEEGKEVTLKASNCTLMTIHDLLIM